MNKTALIQLKNVQKSYFLGNGEEIPVLFGVNAEIKRGEFVAIMGESGGGKSTLMNIIGCLHSLSAGEYILNGEDIGHVRDDYTLSFIRNQKMGFVFQQFNLISKLSALKNVALPGFYAQQSKQNREKKAKDLLSRMGLEDRIHHRPTELSGGQQQRVSIARSLMNDPEILLADEPTGALDSQTGKEILALFLELQKEGRTIIVVTHDPYVAQYADRIIFMKDGLVENQNYTLPSSLQS